MTTTYKYIYTVTCHVNWDAAFVSAETSGGKNAIDGEYEPSLYPKWILVHKESVDTTPVKWTVQKGFEVAWALRFYCEKNVNGTKTLWALDDDVVKNVKATFPASAKVENKTPGIQTQDGNFKLTVQNPGKNKNNVFAFWTKTKQSNFQINKLEIEADIDLGDNYAEYGGDPSTDTKHATLRGVFPTFNVYDAKPNPPIPPAFKDALNEEIDNAMTTEGTFGGIVSTAYAYDRCKNEWYGFGVTARYLGAKSRGKKGYRYRVVTCNPNGTGIKRGTVVKEDLIPGSSKENTNLAAERIKLQKIILANCNGGGGTSGTNGPGTTTPVVPKPKPLDALRWNPPPHANSRSLPYGVAMESIQTASGAVPDAAAIAQATKYLERGRIIQDNNGAAVLNNNPDKLKLPQGDRWGFRFMYNPTVIKYGTASNNSVDWTLGSKDKGTLINGNSTVSFELYLNRIADMSYLRDRYDITTPANPYAPQDSDVYGRELEWDEIQGILNRGTEYDIEFLYRVLNGDPIKNSLLFNADYKGYTADFGYTTATPCWLYLNENMRYFGSVTGFSVDHVIFDLNMVPMLSVVNVNFARYPAMFDSNDSKTQKMAQEALNAYIGGTGIST